MGREKGIWAVNFNVQYQVSDIIWQFHLVMSVRVSVRVAKMNFIMV